MQTRRLEAEYWNESIDEGRKAKKSCPLIFAKSGVQVGAANSRRDPELSAALSLCMHVSLVGVTFKNGARFGGRVEQCLAVFGVLLLCGEASVPGNGRFVEGLCLFDRDECELL